MSLEEFNLNQKPKQEETGIGGSVEGIDDKIEQQKQSLENKFRVIADKIVANFETLKEHIPGLKNLTLEQVKNEADNLLGDFSFEKLSSMLASVPVLAMFNDPIVVDYYRNHVAVGLEKTIDIFVKNNETLIGVGIGSFAIVLFYLLVFFLEHSDPNSFAEHIDNYRFARGAFRKWSL